MAKKIKAVVKIQIQGGKANPAPPEVEIDGGGDEAVAAVRPKTPDAELDEELVTKLSEAMDSEEELELTPEFLARYIPEVPTPSDPPEPVAETAVSQEQITPQETEASLAELATSYRPTNRQDTDWLVILLMISFFVLTIAAIVTIVLLLIQ